MKIFSTIYLGFAALLSSLTSTYVTEARTIAATNEPSEISPLDHVTHFEGQEGALSSPTRAIQVEENNGGSGNEIVNTTDGQSGNSDSTRQSGNTMDSDIEINMLIETLLGDEESDNGFVLSTGGNVMPTGYEGHKHSIQSREVCNDPSGDELRRMLLAGEFFGISEGGTPQDTGDDWFEGEYSPVCSGNLEKTPINKRATCPWTVVRKYRDDRYPKSINYAKCDLGCPWCRTGGSCTQVLEERHVLVRGECKDKVYEYTLATEKVPVACVCEIHRDL